MVQTKWHMAEEQFRDLQKSDRARHGGIEAMTEAIRYHGMNDVWIAFEVGKLWVEIEHTLDPGNWLLYPNVYALGIDDGYGETKKGKIPYALTDIDFHVRTALESDTFEGFKRSCEQLLMEALELPRFHQYKELANADLGDWE